MKRKLIYLVLLTFLLAGAAWAQDVSVRSDHPDEYTVVEGDTLWDISGKFLDHPWQWPAIWHANQQIENPHLIYPGDVVSLVYIDGSPRLMVDRGKEVIKLSPTARVSNRSAISAVPHEAIAGFVRNIRLLNEEQFEGLPYVVSNENRWNQRTDTHRTYVRGLEGEVGQHFAIVRLGSIYYTKKGEKRRAVEPGYGQHASPRIEHHPGFWENAAYLGGNRGPIIGYEVYEVSQAVLLKNGDPAILEMVTGLDVVREGDLVLPLDTIGYPDEYMPHAMDEVPDDFRIIAIQGDNRIVGHQRIVAISGGSNQGVEPGHVFSAFREGERIRDSVTYPAGSIKAAGAWNGKMVDLPDEFEAHIMVFRVFDEVSYALIMQGPSFVTENDVLRHPSETL